MADEDADIRRRVGELLRSYRTAAVVEGRRVSQDRLAALLSREPEFTGTSRFTINRWENGYRGPPSHEAILIIAAALELSEEQRDNLLAAAGYRSATKEEEKATLLEIHADTRAIRREVASLREEVSGLSSRVSQVVNPAAPPIIPVGILSIAGSSVQRTAFPGAYMAGAGVGLRALGLDDEWILVIYVGVALAMVLAQGINRFARSGAGSDGGEADNASKRGFGIGELLFVSLFVMLNTPLLQTTITGLDIYGFYSIPALTGTALPILCAAAVNLGLALLAVTVFHLLWLRLYGEANKGNAYTRAVKTLLPPLAVIYVPAALLSTVGGEIYYLMILALLFGALTAILAFQDPEVKLGEWEAKVVFVTAIAVMFSLFFIAIAGLLVNYLGPQAVPSHNKLWAWQVDWAALGYPAEDFPRRLSAGLLWMGLMGIAYMFVVVGGYLLVTIYRYQVARRVTAHLQ